MEQTTNLIHSPDGDTNHDSSAKVLSFERILKEIGECGRYQISIGLASGIVLAFGSFTILNFVFSSIIIPEHRCHVPECEQVGANSFKRRSVQR